jgi:hypothetical protein
MYKIYATKVGGQLAPDYSTLVPYECQQRNETAKRCIDLFRAGYAVHKVVLPTGAEIQGDSITQALRIGINSVRAAIGNS